MAARPSSATRKRALALPQVDSMGPEQQVRAAGVVRHYRTGDAVLRLERSGLVDRSWAQAGERFRRDFCTAQLDPLRAVDLLRPRGGTPGQIRDQVEEARERLWLAVSHLGSVRSPTGSIAWHVIGAEMSLQRWALGQGWGARRPIRHEVATEILIGALGALAGFYEV